MQREEIRAAAIAADIDNHGANAVEGSKCLVQSRVCRRQTSVAALGVAEQRQQVDVPDIANASPDHAIIRGLGTFALENRFENAAAVRLPPLALALESGLDLRERLAVAGSKLALPACDGRIQLDMSIFDPGKQRLDGVEQRGIVRDFAKLLLERRTRAGQSIPNSPNDG